MSTNGGVVMKTFMRVAGLLFFTFGTSYGLKLVLDKVPEGSKQSSLTKIFRHETPLSSKYVIHFSGNPVCSYLPKESDTKALKEGKPLQLTFFVPMAQVKTAAGKNALHELNKAECHADHCVKIHQVEKPIKGIQCSITLRPEKRALEYQSFQSITGEKGVIFNFYNQAALKSIETKSNSNRIRRTAFAEKPKIILDIGHGGRDPGFINEHVKEKQINYEIGQHLSALLKKKGYEVCMTRQGDEYLALDKRTARVNKCKGAHALISIHTNSASKEHINGIETFCHKSDLFSTQLSYARPHLKEKIDSFDTILHARSNALAAAVHSSVLQHARKQNKEVVDRKVKHKVGQLMLGSEIPSALIELGFLTNKYESQLLQKSEYQKKLAQGIYKGIDQFLKNDFV